MKIIDFTHTISEDMAVYPGTEKPRLSAASTYEKDGFKETLLTMFSHTGTHMDAPAHIFEGRTYLNLLPIEHFVGKALVIDCSDIRAGGQITMDRVKKYRDADSAEFLLFRTGWDKKWGTEDYFGDYPCITHEIAEYLTSSGKKGVGIDTIGIDPISDVNLTVHKLLFQEHDIVVIENLTGLEQVTEGLFTFCALPMKYKDADGAPIRAIGIQD